MLRVQIFVNFTPLVDTHVVRITGGTAPNDLNTYQLLDRRKLKHRYGDGAIKLAMKILRRIKEPK